MRTVLFIIWKAIAILTFAVVAAKGDQSSCEVSCARQPFRSLYADATAFTAAIDKAHVVSSPFSAISGIVVPHDLTAADLIAAAFKLVENKPIKKVVVLFPDHFRKSTLPFATTKRDFSTIFGQVDVSQDDVSRLLAVSDLFEASDLFEDDHGIGAVLPFLKHALPQAKLVPVAIESSSQKSDWDRFLPILHALVDAQTLVVQSTDFSHYLDLGAAVQRDQQTLNLFATGDWDAAARLAQPQNVDSRGANYIQLRLQLEYFKAELAVLFNSNLQSYSNTPQTKTTSYIVAAYGRDTHGGAESATPDSKVFCFAGDTFFGRSLARLLSSPDVAARVRAEAKAVLNGCPLVLNLEGVIVPELPLNLDRNKLAMPMALTLEWLRELNVVAVSLANNHSADLGSDAFDAMARALRNAGIQPLQHATAADLGPFRLFALTDLDNRAYLQSGAVTERNLKTIAEFDGTPPVFAFMHWGVEYETAPTARSEALTEALRRGGVALIIGAHPHVASQGLETIGGGHHLLVFSLGNFLFDQTSDRASGAVLKIRIFKQGTFFPRLIPISNLFEKAAQQNRRD
jgi:AmmeMemoRadiSam system protein B